MSRMLVFSASSRITVTLGGTPVRSSNRFEKMCAPGGASIGGGAVPRAIDVVFFCIEKNVMFCGFPSSESWKSSFVRSAMGLSSPSSAITFTCTSRVDTLTAGVFFC